MTTDEERRLVWRALLALSALAVVAWSAIDAFGWLHGCGVFAAVWLLIPSRKGVSHD